MQARQIRKVFLDFSKAYFKCPHCSREHIDANDKYLKRCNKNKSFTTKINCECGKKFFLMYDYNGNALSFR